MKICFFIPDFKGGGAQHMFVNMANEFARRGHETSVMVLHTDGPYSDKVEKSIRIVNLGQVRAATALPAVVKSLKAEQPDVVISALFHVNILLILARLVLGDNKTKIIVTERNHFTLRVKNSHRLTDKICPLLVKALYRFADQVIGISKGVADDIRKVAMLPEQKVTWIHNPVVTASMIEALKADVDDPWFQASDEPVIVTSGRLVPQKDYETLFKAFTLLRQSKQARLLILGVGVLQDELEARAKALGIREHIHFAGFVENPLAYMKRADLFVMSSVWEGFCNVVVEALLCGLPIVSTDCPSGPAEILADGQYGTLVPVGNHQALAAALEDALDRKVDPQVQKQRAMDFTVEKICDQYEQEIKAL